MKNGATFGARGQMLIAATLAGAAFSNAQVGLVHAIAHVVGARHGVHHGTANAIAMPHVIRFNNDVVADRHRLVAEAMGVDVRGMSDEAAGMSAAAGGIRLRPGGRASPLLPGGRRAGERSCRPAPRRRCPTAQSCTTRKPVLDPARCARRAHGSVVGDGMTVGDSQERVRLAEGAEDVGLAVDACGPDPPEPRAESPEVGGLCPARFAFSLEARDAEVAITLCFPAGTLIIHGGIHGSPLIRISTTAEALLALANVRIVAGLPSLFGPAGRGLRRGLLTGEVKITGMLGRPLSWCASRDSCRSTGEVMRKRAWIFLLIIISAVSAAAQNVNVSYMEGSAMVRHGAAWVPLSTGETVSSSASVRLEEAAYVELNAQGKKVILSRAGTYSLREILSARTAMDAAGGHVPAGGARSPRAGSVPQAEHGHGRPGKPGSRVTRNGRHVRPDGRKADSRPRWRAPDRRKGSRCSRCGAARSR